jgi:hypothetical protein
MSDLVPPRPARTARQYDAALTALLSFAALVLVACSPAIVIGVWRWALG